MRVAASAQIFTVAWIAGLPLERAACEAMFDEEFDDVPLDFVKNSRDINEYSWGRIGKHYLVMVSPPVGRYSGSAMATVAQALCSSLPQIQIGLLVGVGAGIPGEVRDHHGVLETRRDIRLGDVVVSAPGLKSGGVVDLDDGHIEERDGHWEFVRGALLNSPPMIVQSALGKIQAKHLRKGSAASAIIKDALQHYPAMAETYAHPGLKDQRPLQDVYHFQNGESIARACRQQPVIHYGEVGSINASEHSSSHRDHLMAMALADRIDPLCLEMRAAGVMHSFPCLVVRGISNYADEHGTDDWQKYAAITAAAFAKEYLNCLSPVDVPATAPLLHTLQHDTSGISANAGRTNLLLATNPLSEQRGGINDWLDTPESSIDQFHARCINSTTHVDGSSMPMNVYGGS